MIPFEYQHVLNSFDAQVCLEKLSVIGVTSALTYENCISESYVIVLKYLIYNIGGPLDEATRD